MQGAVLYGPRDVRFEEREVPKITKPTDAIIRLSATCICGSDLWPYRGIQLIAEPTPMGHEYCGIVEEVGSAVKSIRPSQFVIGSFFASENTCPTCRTGYQSSCQHRELVGGAQAPLLRVPLADGTLIATIDTPSEELIPSLLTLSDVMGTGWFAADVANVKPGSTVAVVGDGAVGLLGVLAAKQMGATRIIAMSRHESRQKLAREFGATDIVTERADEGIACIKELTNGIGAESVLECVGTQESMMQAMNSTRPGGYVSYVGVPHDVALDGEQLFFSHVHLHGGPAPVRRYLPELIELVLNEKIKPGKGVRFDSASGSGCGGLPGNGSAARDQDAAVPLAIGLEEQMKLHEELKEELHHEHSLGLQRQGGTRHRCGSRYGTGYCKGFRGGGRGCGVGRLQSGGGEGGRTEPGRRRSQSDRCLLRCE
jgi:threonine dehydrogenase-like Zn-dependent dehydrogenase